MICIGYTDGQKRETIARYQLEHAIEKTVVISADAFPLLIADTDQVKYSDVIMYKTFYRLLQEIHSKTLIVLNECLRTQNRYHLAYNCIRNYLNRTDHQLVFQQIPLIDEREDFMVLFDWDTRSRWKRSKFDRALISGESRVLVNPLPVGFEQVEVPTTEKTRQRYTAERERLFRELGKRDPHTLPRNLYLIGGHDKLRYIDGQNLPLFGGQRLYVARNKRFGRGCIVTFEQARIGQKYTIVEFPHRYLDFSDFIQRTGQFYFPVLVADLKVDHWYYGRYQDWAARIYDTYANLHS